MHEPRLIFLDEPTAGIDPVARRDLWDLLFRLAAAGVTLFVTTHYLDEAERCNRVGLMHRGRLICCDTPEALRRPWAGAWYEVLASDPRAARIVLRDVPGVLGVEAAGASLHLFLTPDRTSPEALRQILEKGGFGGSSLRPISPSLEDVFIARVREAGG
jgi:ABC-2 type transport system ATP-binding protein